MFSFWKPQTWFADLPFSHTSWLQIRLPEPSWPLSLYSRPWPNWKGGRGDSVGCVDWKVGTPIRDQEKMVTQFWGEENPIYIDLWFETPKSQRFYHDYIAGKNLSSKKQPMVSSVGKSLVTTGDSYRTVAIPITPKPWLRLKSKKKLLCHASLVSFRISKKMNSIDIRNAFLLPIHFMAPAPVWVQQSSLTDVREGLMALHWAPICTCNGCLSHRWMLTHPRSWRFLMLFVKSCCILILFQAQKPGMKGSNLLDLTFKRVVTWWPCNDSGHHPWKSYV